MAGQNSRQKDNFLRRWHLGAPLSKTLHGVRWNHVLLCVWLHWGMQELKQHGCKHKKSWVKNFCHDINKGLILQVVDVIQEFSKWVTKKDVQNDINLLSFVIRLMFKMKLFRFLVWSLKQLSNHTAIILKRFWTSRKVCVIKKERNYRGENFHLQAWLNITKNMGFL